jgi:hypothetical protein
MIPDWVWISAALFVGAAVGTYILPKVPGAKAWILNICVKGYAYLDSVKADVPEEAMPTWQAAYDELDAIIEALGDDKLTAGEIRHCGKHAIELILSVKKLVG